MTAASPVFAIPELLENILLRVPERGLLLAQRVNTFFRDIITNSSHLQRKLFSIADTILADGQVPELMWNPLFEVFNKQWQVSNGDHRMLLRGFVRDPRFPRSPFTDEHLDRAIFNTA